MIGVRASEADQPWVREFFELFKTPWEPAAPGRRYRVLLDASGIGRPVEADVVLAYGSTRSEADPAGTVRRGPSMATWGGRRVPLYAESIAFRDLPRGGELQTDDGPLHVETADGPVRRHRLGYNLFKEVAHLIRRGQPVQHAGTPTLDLHIALLRDLLERSGASWVEIPPRPYGHPFVCCLTHDIDFFGIRRHLADRTLAGMIGRATFGTLRDLLRGRRPLGEAVRNWLSVAKLPFVFLGLARDFWQPLAEYAHADRGLPATFFLVPFKNQPGIGPDGRRHSLRAVPYGVSEISRELKDAANVNIEYAVHGLDAWRDAAAGRAERTAVADATGGDAAGVRMHWLYFSEQSPAALEAVGFRYDATCGFNNAVGYRAGTLQPFVLDGTRDVVGLPLAIMDTALFYPDRMDLSRREALDRCRGVVDHAAEAGGALVINWHDRSLVPERQWRKPYDALLDDVQSRTPWFATAARAVDWFKWRRSIRLTAAHDGPEVELEAPTLPDGLPGAGVIVHQPGQTLKDVAEFRGGKAVRML